MKHLLSFGAPFILSSCKNCATAFRNGSANRMGVARLMAPTAQPLVKPTAAPPPTPRMHSPPVITTSPAAAVGSSNGAGNGAEAGEAEPTETTPLNVNERETHFGGVSEVVSESGNGHNAAAGDRLDPSSAAAAAANCLAPAGAAVGPGGGLSVSQRVRRVSMAMSIASEGKKVAPEISLDQEHPGDWQKLALQLILNGVSADKEFARP